MNDVKSIAIKNLVVGSEVRIRFASQMRDCVIDSVEYKVGPLPYTVRFHIKGYSSMCSSKLCRERERFELVK